MYIFCWFSTKLFLCFPGATPPSSFPTRPMSLWSQTVPGLCYQPKWPESLWGLWWGTETVQVLPWWVCKLKIIRKTSIKKVSESSLIFSKRNIEKKLNFKIYGRKQDGRKQGASHNEITCFFIFTFFPFSSCRLVITSVKDKWMSFNSFLWEQIQSCLTVTLLLREAECCFYSF